MAKELAHFKNFAKLKDTAVEFNDITVLAGKPGTGKSYVMKMMYAMGAATDRHRDAIEIYSKNYEPLIKQMKDFSNLSETEQSDLTKMFQKVKRAKEELDSLGNPLEENQNKIIQNVYKNTINSIFTNMSQISNNFEIMYNNVNLKYIDNILKVNKNSNYKKESTNLIFVETPLILEFHKHMDRREAKTPYHIESLLNILDEDYSFTDEEQDELIKSFSQKANTIISGDLKNKNGSFVYSRNNDKDYNIFNASSGIKSIGLLQYLVTNKAIKRGSVLFWEEPEVHLHPEWQLRMVELFVELMNAGVKIVFSTHSPYMADYLNAISQKNNYRDRISFNVLDEKGGIVSNHILDDDNWNILQSELMDTFEDILWEYL